MAPPSWAYQVEFFSPSPDEELICSICRCVFCEPMECPCQHAFCKACIVRWLNVHRNCPICRKRTGESQLRPVIPLLNNMIMKLNLHCHNQEAGCEASFMLEACENHLKECLYELVECSLGCGKLVFRKDVSNHKSAECPFRFTKCDKCKLKVYGQWEDHSCVAALQLAMKDIEKERDELKKEVEALKMKVRDLTKQLEERSNHRDSDLSSLEGFWSSCSNSSGFSNPIVRLHSDTDDSSDSDTSAYMEDAADEPESPDYHAADGGDDRSENDDEDDGHNYDEMNNENNRDNNDDDVSVEQSVDRILQDLTSAHHDIENVLNNVGAGESSYQLDDDGNEGDNDHGEQQRLSGEEVVSGRENDAQTSSAMPEPTIVIGSSSSEDSDRESTAPSFRRYNLKRRFGSPNSFSLNYDDDHDAGSRKTQRSSSNECSNDDTELNIMNDNVAAYAMCSTTEQEAVPSTSTGFVASNFSNPSRGKLSKDKRGSRLKLLRSMNKEKASDCGGDDKAQNGSKTTQKKTQADRSATQRIFEGTLSLLEQHTIDSDPEWFPGLVYNNAGMSTSSSSSSSTSNSNNNTSRSTPLDFLSSDDSLSEATESDSSYEVEIPPSTYDLLERYSARDSCEESDSDYVPEC